VKRWFDFSSNGNGVNGAGAGLAIAHVEEVASPSGPPPSPQPMVCGDVPASAADFAQIYKRAGIPVEGWGILRVIEMVHSPHLAGMSAEGKRCALRMALDAVGSPVESVLQDAVKRQAVLNEYEKEQLARLQLLEERKADETRRLQEELDDLTRDFMARMQRAMDGVSREQDEFRGWQKRKQLEFQRIADAAALCVPEAMGSHAPGLSAVLERACAARA
jgi:hypothetical protein